MIGRSPNGRFAGTSSLDDELRTVAGEIARTEAGQN